MTTDVHSPTTPANTSQAGTPRYPGLTTTVLSALCASGLYHESDWAAGALRGGDLVTLVVVVPVLVVAAWRASRGSTRAQLIWAAMLVYNLYNYTYIVFGTT